MTRQPTPRCTPDPSAGVHFLGAAYAPDDWIAVLAKAQGSGAVVQRIRPRTWFTTPQAQAWLRALNARRWSLYVSINSFAPGQRSRRRGAVAYIRHLMLDVDRDGAACVRRIQDRHDLPPPSYLLHSSPDRLHVLWRVTGFDCHLVERLQRHLAGDLTTDGAATACSQTTRVPGFANHKYRPPSIVTVEYLDVRAVYGPSDFPPPAPEPLCERPGVARARGGASLDVRERARRYLAATPPAIAGQHGDQHTFQVCCRLARGFALNDADALDVLSEWNARCEPPWTTRELHAKLQHARRYGREPTGALLDSS